MPDVVDGDLGAQYAMRSAALEHLGDGVWLVDDAGEVHYRNRMAASMESMYWSRGGAVGTMEDVVFARTRDLLGERAHFVAEFHLSGDHDQQRSVVLEIQRMTQPSGGILMHARDVSREWLREQTLHDRHIELEQAYRRLEQTQSQLLQSEKMASIGQLAAGVAHEINNPIGYVHSNLGTLQTYVSGLLRLLDAYQLLVEGLGSAIRGEALAIADIERQIDYTFLREDLPQLLVESREGIERVKKIVLDLRDFSHGGQGEVEQWARADLHRGIESALNIVRNELKYKAVVRKDFGTLPLVECVLSQLNQVFLNLLVNAGQAIESDGEIWIRTRCEGAEVCVQVRDNGIGMPPEVRKRVFDPFYTTKPVGKGTGLGLSLSYGIVKNHHGRIEVDSEPGAGTEFRIYLPVQQSRGASAAVSEQREYP
ncbi:MAG: histidine kinase [Lysobacterales bacterium]|nr:Signal transduction histidine-protein kinase AtoS [Xanthomonadales bacterium]